jgi:hypothetical protein
MNPANAGRITRELGAQHLLVLVASVERQASSEHTEGDDPDGVEIRPVIELGCLHVG